MSDEQMKLPPKVFTILDYEVEHVMATLEVLEFEASESGDVSEEMLQEAKNILNSLSDREKTVSEIIKEYGQNGYEATSDKSNLECKVESN